MVTYTGMLLIVLILVTETSGGGASLLWCRRQQQAICDGGTVGDAVYGADDDGVGGH